MKINEVFAIMFLLAVGVSYFYNPVGFSNWEILVMLLLAIINWNITKIKGDGE